MPNQISIDHATFAGSDLDQICQTFRTVGFEPVYGGAHSNGITHMALVGFPDGSYLELIASRPETAGQISPWWDKPIRLNGGPCAWAVRHTDLSAESQRLQKMGIPVFGPTAFTRQRPDGFTITWELLFLNQGDPGAVLPFLIRDTTPRELRVQPNPGLKDGPFSGLSRIILGVHTITPWMEIFQKVFAWDSPETVVDAQFGAVLAVFPNQPVILAEPLEKDGWLHQRLERFGEIPCAFLIATSDWEAAQQHLPVSAEQSWGTALHLSWITDAAFRDGRLGICRI